MENGKWKMGPLEVQSGPSLILHFPFSPFELRFRSPRQLHARLARHQHRNASATTEDARLATRRHPDVDDRAFDQSAGIVDEKAAQVAASVVQLDVSRERKEPGICRDDSGANI